MTTSKTYFIIAFDSGAKGVRYIDNKDSETGTYEEYGAKPFDTREEAQSYIDTKGYVAWVQEIEDINQ